MCINTFYSFIRQNDVIIYFYQKMTKTKNEKKSSQKDLKLNVLRIHISTNSKTNGIA